MLREQIPEFAWTFPNCGGTNAPRTNVLGTHRRLMSAICPALAWSSPGLRRGLLSAICPTPAPRSGREPSGARLRAPGAGCSLALAARLHLPALTASPGRCEHRRAASIAHARLDAGRLQASPRDTAPGRHRGLLGTASLRWSAICPMFAGSSLGRDFRVIKFWNEEKRIRRAASQTHGHSLRFRQVQVVRWRWRLTRWL